MWPRCRSCSRVASFRFTWWARSTALCPDGPSDKSVVILQNELAIARCQQAPLARIIWLPEGTTSGSPQQQQFIDALLKDASQQVGADLITGDIESLKSAMHAALKKIEAAAAASRCAAAKASCRRCDVPAEHWDSPRRRSAKLVYILCDERDRKATIPLRKALQAAWHRLADSGVRRRRRRPCARPIRTCSRNATA